MVLSSLSSSVFSERSPMTFSKVTGRFRLLFDCVCLLKLKNVAIRIFCFGTLRVFLVLLDTVLASCATISI